MTGRHAPMPEKTIQLAVIGAAHGLKGEVRVKSFTADPLALREYRPLTDGDGRVYEITAIRRQGDMLVVRFEGIADRDAAEAVKGKALFVGRAALPGQADEDEFYHADLIGLCAEDADGAAWGRIIAIHDFGGGDILELALPPGGSAMIPFTKDAVPLVDIAAGRVVVNPGLAGLLPEADDAEKPA